MSEHREWEYNSVGASVDKAKEHNATVRAYRDAMAECERLGKINDSMCDTIAELEREVRTATEHADTWSAKVRELESRPALTREECDAKLHDLNPSVSTFGEFERDIMIFLDWLKSRLPAPTDSIRVPFSDAQIEAMAKAAEDCYEIDPDATFESAIRAALAAGGLEPCAVPEYKPEDVALRPERASDEELAKLVWSSLYGLYPRMKPYNYASALEQGIAAAVAAAVRARVEAPLLAEIERLEIECRDRAFYVTEFAAVSQERDTLKARVAELDAALRQRDTVPVKVRLPDVEDVNGHLIKHNFSTTTHTEMGEALRFAAAHAVIDVPQGVPGLQAIHELYWREREGITQGLHVMSGTEANAYTAIRDAVLRGMGAEPEREEWIGDPEPNSDDVAAVYDEDDATFSHALYEMIKNTPRPTALERRTMMAHCGAMWRAYHKALSNQYPTPHEPTDAEVEALARVLCDAWVGSYDVTPESWLRAARAAFAHIGKPTRSNAEMQVCINRKNKRIDALKACVKKWKAKAAAPIASAETLEQLAEIATDAYTRAPAPDWGTRMQYVVAAILRAAKARVDVTLRDLKELCAGHSADAIDYLNSRIVYGVQLPEDNFLLRPIPDKGMTVGECLLALSQTEGELTRAVRALERAGFQDHGAEDWKPPIGPEPRWYYAGPTRAEAEAKIAEQGGGWHDRFVALTDWLLPQLPSGRAEMPSSEWLADILKTVPALQHQSKLMRLDRAEKILSALRPWLRTPTGWELDVTGAELYRNYQANPKSQTWFDFAIDFIKSRIRPTFECQECAVWKTTYERDKAGWQERAGRARAALEVE